EQTHELNCMSSLITLIQVLCEEKEPYSLPYSALFEPALRLLEKLCNVESLSSEPVLRFMRNQHKLIYSLTQSSIFQSAHDDSVEKDDEMEEEGKVSVHLATFNRQIRGLILQLIAVDFTVSMNGNHVQTAKDYLAVLLSASGQHSRAILWS